MSLFLSVVPGNFYLEWQNIAIFSSKSITYKNLRQIIIKSGNPDKKDVGVLSFQKKKLTTKK